MIIYTWPNLTSLRFLVFNRNVYLNVSKKLTHHSVINYSIVPLKFLLPII